jgi:hypothetical protein
MGKRLQHVAPKAGVRQRAVEENPHDAGMFGQEGGKIVGDDGRRRYVSVQAAFPFAALEHVPQGQAGVGQFLQACRIRERRARAEEFAEYRPEQIAPVGIVFAGRQRGLPGHAAEDQRMGIGRRNGREAVEQSHRLAPRPALRRFVVRRDVCRARVCQRILGSDMI